MDEGGYPLNIFISPPGDDFTCPICTDILRDPTQCPNGHLFCRHCIIQCINIKPKCPTCSVSLFAKNLSNGLLVKNLINGMLVFCPNAMKDPDNARSKCTWTGPLSSMQKHLELDCSMKKNKFMHGDLLDICNEEFNNLASLNLTKNITMRVNSEYNCRIRRDKSVKSDQVGLLPNGQSFQFSIIQDGWAKIAPSEYEKLSHFSNPFGWYESQRGIISHGWCIVHIDGSQMLTEEKVTTSSSSAISRLQRQMTGQMSRGDIRMQVSSSFNCRVRRNKSTSSPQIGLLKAGMVFSFMSIEDGWAKLSPQEYDIVSQFEDGIDPRVFGWCLILNSDGERLLHTITEDEAHAQGREQNDEELILTVSSDRDCRVRLHPTTSSDQVGLLLSGSTFKFCKIANGWAKLSPCEYDRLRHGRNFTPHDVRTEGWCIMSVNGQQLLFS